MAKEYDVAVIGTGPGGYIAALKAAQLGASTAVVEKRHLGGTCLNNGCIPSKALLASAELNHHIAHASEMGIDVDGSVSVNWKAIQKRKDKVIRRLRNGVGSLFKARGVDSYEGRGVLDGQGQVKVLDSDGNETDGFSAKKIILAIGSLPARVPGWPEDTQKVTTTDEALHFKTLPESLLIVGGGVIGCEFGCMMRALGVEVTMVEMLPRLLPMLDPDLSSGMKEVLEGRGITVHTDTRVEDLKTAKKGIKATLGGGETVEADRVLVAIGRRPETEGLGLDSIGLETGKKGFIQVNDRMETDVEGVYCIGDANGRVLLAHAASGQGIVASRNATGEDVAFTAPVPNAVYTFPEVANVGMTAEEAREQSIPITIGKFPMGHLGKAMTVAETDGFAKVIRHRGTDAILGVHMMGHNVTECIAAATALLHTSASTHEAAEMIAAHPTISESLKEATEDALGAAMHLPPRKAKAVMASV